MYNAAPVAKGRKVDVRHTALCKWRTATVLRTQTMPEESLPLWICCVMPNVNGIDQYLKGNWLKPLSNQAFIGPGRWLAISPVLSLS